MGLISCPDCHRQVSDAAPACPGCGRSIAPVPVTHVAKKAGAGIGCGTLLILGLVAAAVWPEDKESRDEAPDQLPSTETSIPAPEEKKPTAPKPKGVLDAKTPAEAVSIANYWANGSTPRCARLVGEWAQIHPMTWGDVYVKRDEVSLRAAQKDPVAARGKRLCYSGELLAITRADGMHEGQLMTRQGNIHFLAVGSTGDLVADSRARICGVVTGMVSGTNAFGGTVEAVQVVGMFNLPANTGVVPKRKRKRRPPSVVIDPFAQ